MPEDRDDLRAGRRLEGPGSDRRLRRVRAKFRGVSVRTKVRRPGRDGRIGLTIWLTVWASCVGATLYLVLGRWG